MVRMLRNNRWHTAPSVERAPFAHVHVRTHAPPYPGEEPTTEGSGILGSKWGEQPEGVPCSAWPRSTSSSSLTACWWIGNILAALHSPNLEAGGGGGGGGGGRGGGGAPPPTPTPSYPPPPPPLYLTHVRLVVCVEHSAVGAAVAGLHLHLVADQARGHGQESLPPVLPRPLR